MVDKKEYTKDIAPTKDKHLDLEMKNENFDSNVMLLSLTLLILVTCLAAIATHKAPPVYTEEERIQLIGAVKWVDEVNWIHFLLHLFNPCVLLSVQYTSLFSCQSICLSTHTCIHVTSLSNVFIHHFYNVVKRLLFKTHFHEPLKMLF